MSKQETFKIGLNKAENVARATHEFCDAMEMSQEQRDCFVKLMCTLMNYTAVTAVDAATCAMGRYRW